MKKFVVSTDRPYEIIIEKDIIKHAGSYIKECIPPCHLCIVTDSTVNSLYAQVVMTSLMENGYRTSKIVFPAGEHSKNLTTYTNILEALAEEGLTRGDGIVALGGGVVGDLAAFAASTYMRGISYVQIPTTYMSALDSSIGGKTSVNLQAGKNLAGAFWQPSLVLCDCKTFDSLSPDRLMDGAAEAVKSAVISEASLIPHIMSNDFEYVIERCISIKKSIVEADERDMGLRQLLSFGHTIAHGIERLSSYYIPHGRAVAMGMIIEARGAYKMGLTETDISTALEVIFTGLGYNLSNFCDADDLYRFALKDKKISGDKITMIVPESLGKCKLQKISLSELKRFIELGLEK